jgi:hypothetical protein
MQWHHYSNTPPCISSPDKLKIKWLLTYDIPRNGTITETLHHKFPSSYRLTVTWSMVTETRVGSKPTFYIPKILTFQFCNETKVHKP